MDEKVIKQTEREGEEGKENGRGQTDSGQTREMSEECSRE